MLIWPFVNILVPDYAAMIQGASFAPAIIIELIIGGWLLLKGVNVQHQDNKAVFCII